MGTSKYNVGGGVTLQWASSRSRGSRNTPNRFMLVRHWNEVQPDWPLGLYAAFTLPRQCNCFPTSFSLVVDHHYNH